MCFAPSGSFYGKIDMWQFLLCKFSGIIDYGKMWYTAISDIVLACEFRVDIKK